MRDDPGRVAGADPSERGGAPGTVSCQHLDDGVEVVGVGGVARPKQGLVVVAQRDEDVDRGAADVGPPQRGDVDVDAR